MASFVYGLLNVAGGGKLLSYIVIVYLWEISIQPPYCWWNDNFSDEKE